MNNLERLICGLPEETQNKALQAAESSNDCCDVYCKSIEVVEEHIATMRESLVAFINVSEEVNDDGMGHIDTRLITRAKNAIK